MSAIAGARVPARRLGRYELFREVAAGGMAKVWLARASGPGGFDKVVALKVIQPELARDRSAIEMFLDEARLASRIEHPNVCPVFDFGSADGQYFLAMEYLQGEPIQNVIRALAARPDELSSPRIPFLMARVIADACEGLHFAHELRDARGEPLHVVHRDVSPHNLFLTYAGALRVVDFGIADALGKQHRTLTGVVKGKVAYMSPEQLDAGDVDRRTDVWALGVTLWEMLTCTRLFKREADGATLQAVLNAPIPPPSSVRGDLPADLDAIVLKALERDRTKRWATAREMGRELARCIASRGEAVGIPELGDLMAGLFANEREEKRRLLEEARGAAPAPPAAVSAQDPTAPANRSVRSSPAPLAAPAPPAAPEETASEVRSKRPSFTTGSVSLPIEKRSRFLLPALAAAGTFAAILIVWSATQSSSEPPTPAPTLSPPPSPSPSPSPSPPPPPPPSLSPSPPPSPSPTPSPGPTPTPTPSRRVSNEPGTVDIATPGGWAEVRIDGEPRGRTPTRVTLAPGAHQIELLPYGESPALTRRARIPAGGRTRVVVPIDPR